MKQTWFIPWGWCHRPAAVAGWLVTLAAVAYMLHVFLAIDARSHSVSDTLYAVYPQWGVTLLGWDWIARASQRSQA
ncbi:MAG: hypothetical protein OQK79_04095 [Rhodanobacter sp.]|nr:hypothetical protein [Rhodanobacter sp.]